MAVKRDSGGKGCYVTSLPHLPDMRPIALEDQSLLRGYLDRDDREQSELTFTNLFIWRHAYELRLSQVDGALAIFAWRPDPDDSFVFPPQGEGATSETVQRCLRHLAEDNRAAVMARATARDIRRLRLDGDGFAIEPDRDNWDYVYLVEDLIKLVGNKYHDKRNHIQQFLTSYEFAYRPLLPEMVPACQDLQDRWCDEKHCDLAATLHAEAGAVKEVLASFEALNVTGGCIEIEGRIEAFTLGELLNPDTVVIHVEKANPSFHGLYQVINQQFLEHEWSGRRFVNREQDMGVTGLRRAKQSYHPDHMVEKFTVKAK